MSKSNLKTKEDYNEDPVEYCNFCLSLNIIQSEPDLNNTSICYCTKCGNIEIEETNIEEWEKLYYRRYKKSHL